MHLEGGVNGVYLLLEFGQALLGIGLEDVDGALEPAGEGAKGRSEKGGRERGGCARDVSEEGGDIYTCHE
jgi:hypothetical protein